MLTVTGVSRLPFQTHLWPGLGASVSPLGILFLLMGVITWKSCE